MEGLPEPTLHSDWFSDDRGDGRRLQVTWHPEHRLVVLSIWQRDRCTASFRLPVEDADRMITLLAGSLREAATTPAWLRGVKITG
jgi:hypothetical protein